MDKTKITEIMTEVDEINSAVSQPLMPIANVFIKEEPIDDKETVFIDDKVDDDDVFNVDEEDENNIDDEDNEDEGETEYGINVWPVTVKLDMDGDDGLEGDDDDDDDDDNYSFKDGNENSGDNNNRNNNLVGRKRKKLLKMRKKKKLMLYFCKQCNVKFNTEMEFNMHTRTTHYSNVSPNFNSNKFTCLLCKKIFNSRTYLDAHVIRTHTEKKTINCIKCNKVFKYRSYLISNKDNNTSKKAKSVTPKESNENKQFTCFHCNLKKS